MSGRAFPPVSSDVDSRGQGQGGGDDRTPHGMAGNRWLARCRPAVTLKASEGKTSKKKKKVSKTSDDRQYSRSGSAVLFSCETC